MSETVTLQALFSAKFEALHHDIEALRILEQHDLAATKLRIDDATVAIAMSLAASTESVRRSDAATEKRFDSINEFRAQLKDQTATFLSRTETTALIESVKFTIEQNRSQLQTFVPREEVRTIALGLEKISTRNKEQIDLMIPRSEVQAQNDRNEQIGRSVDTRLKMLETSGASRSEIDTRIGDLAARIGALSTRIDRAEGQASVTDPTTSTALTDLTQEVMQLRTRSDRGTGVSAGSDRVLGYLVGAGGLLIALFSFIASHMQVRP